MFSLWCKQNYRFNESPAVQSRVTKQAEFIQAHEATWRQIKQQYGGSQKQTGQGGGDDGTIESEHFVGSPDVSSKKLPPTPRDEATQDTKSPPK